MTDLFSDDEGTNDAPEVQLTINEHYAKAFEYKKEREELERLKAKYGSDAEESDITTDSESDESEDEDGEELTPAVDAAILRTLARIRNRDPAIYDSEKNIFGEEQEQLSAKAPVLGASRVKAKEKAKPVTIRQANLESMINGSRSPSPEPPVMTHTEEQDALRRETIAAFNAAIDEAGDDFLVEREKTKDELERETEEYKAFLQREVGNLEDIIAVDRADAPDEVEPSEPPSKEKGKKKKKKSKKSSDKDKDDGKASNTGDKDQQFLLDYILNRGWIDKSQRSVPTYNDVTSSKRKKGKARAKDADSDAEGQEEDDAGALSDASFESLASHFEASYNHRYEEPDAAVIPSFPRNIESTVRRQDSSRKDARERKKERKEEEIKKRREEVQRLKALKMREIKRKLAMIGKQGGLKSTEDGGVVDEALMELDLEGEWDPEKHDRQMLELFDKEEEDVDEGEVDGEVDDGVRYGADGKPVWDEDIDIGNIVMSDDDAKPVENKKKKKKKKKGGEDEDIGVDVDAMDADLAPDHPLDEEWDGTEEMRKRKLDEYMDEIYKLDFNDMVGDLPTRFKYVPVQPQNYNLTPVEILLADDKDLNEYIGIKKYAPYRQEKGNPAWKKSNQEKLHVLKEKLAERTGSRWTGARNQNSNSEEQKPKKRMGKKERQRLKAAAEGGEEQEANVEEPRSSGKRKRDVPDGPTVDDQIAVDLSIDANTPKKKKRRQRKKGADTEVQDS